MPNFENLLKMFIGQGGTPEQFISNALGTKSNPIFNNLIKMAREGNNKGVSDFAENFCKEKGIDFKKEFPAFMKMVNGK